METKKDEDVSGQDIVFMRNMINMPIGENGGRFVRMCNEILEGKLEFCNDGYYSFSKSCCFPEQHHYPVDFFDDDDEEVSYFERMMRNGFEFEECDEGCDEENFDDDEETA